MKATGVLRRNWREHRHWMAGWKARPRRLREGLLAACLGWSLAVCAAPAVQEGGKPAPDQAEARAWLVRMQEAQHRNFQGNFVVSAGSRTSSSHIVHYCDGRNQYERIEVLDGPSRIVFRHNDVVQTVFPSRQLAVIGQRESLAALPLLLRTQDDRIVSHYEIQSLGSDRVAGHEAQVLQLTPKDAYRFGYRLWAERESGLLLRAEILGPEGQILEWSAFSEVQIGVKAKPAKVLAAMKRLDGYEVKQAVIEKTDLAQEGWALQDIPTGFRVTSVIKRPVGTLPAAASKPVMATDGAVPMLQAIYSDGLTYVSVFIEPFNASVHRREAMMALGATQTLMRRQGAAWVTVMGDVPTVTLQAFAKSVRRLN